MNGWTDGWMHTNERIDGWMDEASKQARDTTGTSCPAPFRGRSSSAKFSKFPDPAFLCVVCLELTN